MYRKHFSDCILLEQDIEVYTIIQDEIPDHFNPLYHDLALEINNILEEATAFTDIDLIKLKADMIDLLQSLHKTWLTERFLAVNN